MGSYEISHECRLPLVGNFLIVSLHNTKESNSKDITFSTIPAQVYLSQSDPHLFPRLSIHTGLEFH